MRSPVNIVLENEPTKMTRPSLSSIRRLNRLAAPPELAVVIILDNKGLSASCPIQQRPSSLQRQDRARRVLTAGAYDKQAGVPVTRYQSRIVDGDGSGIPPLRLMPR